MNVLLTGGTGFIGQHVAQCLDRHGHTRRTDLPYDVAIHLAWYVEPGKYLESPLNDKCLADSLALVKATNCRRWLVAGTSFEYASSDKPMREDNPTGPRTRYARAKLDLFTALQQLDIELVWPRLFYLYGPHEKQRRFVPIVINALLENRPAPLTDGTEVRDFLHVEDVADAMCAVAASKLTGVVNIGSSQPVTIRQVACQIAEIIGRPELLRFGEYTASASDAPVVVADTTKLRSVWQPQISLPAGLRQTVEWWRQQCSPATSAS